MHDFLTVGASHPLQEAAVTGLRFGGEYYADLQKFLRGMWELVLCQVHLFFKENENRYVRLHFAKKDETLNEALNCLENIRKLI